ncbi:hypothetical protein CR513_25571, partial [Mucuna pruriens]
MIEAVENYGPHLKPPSYHELRVPLLKQELEYTKDLLKGHEEVESKATKDPKGKKAIDIVLIPSFWNDVVYVQKATGPIVRVLRLVDTEKGFAMSYIYEAMDRAKKAIQNFFNGNEDSIRISLQSLIVVGIANFTTLCMQRVIFSNIEMDCEVLEGFYKYIDRLSENDEFVDHVHNELPIYKRVGACRDAIVIGVSLSMYVASTIGAVEPLKYTRRQTQMQRVTFAFTSRKEKGKGVGEEEDEDESSQDEGEEEDNSSSNRSDEDNDMELQEDENI